MSVLPIYFKKWLFVFPFSGIIFFSFLVPRTHAMEPVSMVVLGTILAPYAKQYAGQAAAYAYKGGVRTIPGWINAGTQLFNIFRLPLGVLQGTLGAPFGLLSNGVENTWKGGAAPFLMGKEILCMPLYFFGVM